MTQVTQVRRALLAVYDKHGLVDLGRALIDLGVTLVSSGGTAAVLSEAGLAVTPVEDLTGWPEMLGGRVKTLHPAIHGGILADRRKRDHADQLASQGIEPFDLVVVNLYPFRETVAAGAGFDEVIEKIDIGGPAMVRAAAKNFESVGVVVDPTRYDDLVEELTREGGLTRETRRALAADAFAHTAAYDAAVASWFADHDSDERLPAFIGLAYEKLGDLRYGENPHQRGALYREAAGSGPLGGAQVLQGKDMSFNNWLDAYAAYDLVAALPDGAAVIVKHNNPCGVATMSTLAASYRAAFACDEVSAFGGIVAFRGAVDIEAAAAMAEVFTEVVIAPSFTPAASEAFADRPNLRVVAAPLPDGRGLDVRPLPGGALVQDRDLVTETRGEWKVVSSREPSVQEWSDLELAWTIAWRVKSNTIVLAKEGATVGVGAGQMSRVDASWIATRKAGARAEGAVVASDAFFPFSDALEVAADAGCTAVIHPGGSKGDEAVLAAAEERGMAVVLTGTRHFRH
ncbi:MAG: bifunctional phosphoribosylaminoimidazolecarboxamide formyltransferase/IMP cyclohydrolase [Actinomycetota bacterium]|nr:bifunctional phosphoribosylaminoimidazolecarboxamide formyltransferase/IMP cyclohydrolase [Actinomycetota bacterium]MDH5223508.1 bifunctional phosphoribosylaminoimidazolecarboxamide formyltransferase/IMP cyclohydrolase [Actinomycetota bacterium]MDH5313353.1 bifunctional phosphoribosylaminoimidazolecarboxamide formyltransferase/IMP cyclohydrolase [Actinomycetota bacterium]